MGITTTLVLDDFNGLGTQSPLSNQGKWATMNGSTYMEAFEGKARGAWGASDAPSYWTPAQFGPDCEVWVTVADIGGASDICQLHARVQQPGSFAFDSYSLMYVNPNGFQIRRIDNATPTNLGGFISQTFNAGDGLALQCIADQIKAWRKPKETGVWELFATRTDSTYAGAGYIAIDGYATVLLENFGGGTMVLLGDDDGDSFQFVRPR